MRRSVPGPAALEPKLRVLAAARSRLGTLLLLVAALIIAGFGLYSARLAFDQRVRAELAGARASQLAWLEAASSALAKQGALTPPEAARQLLRVSAAPGERTRFLPGKSAFIGRPAGPMQSSARSEVYAFDAHGRVLTENQAHSAPGAYAYSQAAGNGVVLTAHVNGHGANVVGAYAWLPELELGVAVEREHADTYALLRWLQGAIALAALGLAAAACSIGSGRMLAERAEETLHRAETYGQYTLGRKLGEGGMGVVYLASHQLLRRPTAIKLLRTGEGDQALRAEAMQRFEREVQLTSQLTHPNTIVIYDYGQTDEGTFYYAMEYVEGVDLERLVRLDGPLPAARIIHLALQICGSLAEAHGHGLIHRDIKPANILVCERGGVPDSIKVLDFGLVKSVYGPAMSGSNVLVGTPLYMAPEIIRTPSAAGPRSDIYSLGAVLHWLATAMTVPDAAMMSVNFRPPSAHEGEVEGRAPGDPYAHLPLDLERVIMRCIDSDPYERPASALELAAELMRCRDAGRWSGEDARAYWATRGQQLSHLLAHPARADARTLAAT